MRFMEVVMAADPFIISRLPPSDRDNNFKMVEAAGGIAAMAAIEL